MIPTRTQNRESSSRILRFVKQPYTLALIGTLLATVATFVSLRPRTEMKQAPQTDSVNVYFAVKDGKSHLAIRNALVESLGDSSVVTTDDSGIARISVSGKRSSSYKISAPGFKVIEQTIQSPQVEPNVVVYLAQLQSLPDGGTRKVESSNLEPYVQAFKSGPTESGVGEEFSPWYQVQSAPPRPGFIVDEGGISYALAGDRSCGSWSECRIVSSPTQVTFRFRTQGHSEFLTRQTSFSEAILTVRYKPITP